MGSLNWQDVPSKTPAKPADSSANIWFGISMGLIGFIASFILAGIL